MTVLLDSTSSDGHNTSSVICYDMFEGMLARIDVHY